MSKLTLEDVRQMDCDMLTVSQVAQVVGADPQTIRMQAREDATALGYPITRIQSRLYIPRLGFINFMEGNIAKGSMGEIA